MVVKDKQKTGKTSSLDLMSIAPPEWGAKKQTRVTEADARKEGWTVRKDGTIEVHGNLILRKDMHFNNPLKIIDGSIIGEGGVRYDLQVHGNLDAQDIKVSGLFVVGAINAGHIDAENIGARDIHVLDIRADSVRATGSIEADFIVCSTISLPKGARFYAKHVITNKEDYIQKRHDISKLQR